MRDILALDDQPWWEGIVTDAIGNGQLPDCKVHPASTHRQALKLIADRLFDVALLDFSLDAGTGIEVAHALRNRQPGVPIYIVTVKREHDLLPLCAPHNFRIIEKSRPDIANAIVEAIREALDEYHAPLDPSASGPSPATV